MRWLRDPELVSGLIILVAIIGAAIATVVWVAAALLSGEEKEFPDPTPIGYTLYDVTNNRIIDIQPCPHSWRLAPDWYSTDQWMPDFGRKYDFAYGVATLGGIIAELKPVGYEVPAECGPGYE